jgi:hypothetical protein
VRRKGKLIDKTMLKNILGIFIEVGSRGSGFWVCLVSVVCWGVRVCGERTVVSIDKMMLRNMFGHLHPFARLIKPFMCLSVLHC